MKQHSTLYYLSALAAALGLATTASAEAPQWTVQGKTLSVDTVYHANIGPGTSQTNLRLSGSIKLELAYTTIDLTHPYVDMRVTKASNMLTGGAKLSSMSKSASKEDAEYFAGVNADFFGGNRPIGNVVVDGTTIYGVNNGWDCWWMTDDKKPGVGHITFKGSAKSGEKTHAVSGINADRGENNLIIYNSRRGSTTGTNVYGLEVRMELIEGNIGFTGSARCRIIGQSTSSALSLTDNQLVLSGNGTAKDFVASLSDGDIVEFTFTTEIPGGGNISQLAGGKPMILSDGKVLNTESAIDHLPTRQPRTAIGYNEDKTKVVMLIVDGRSSTSVGCTSKELADIMHNLGCTEALNFDGGGSSELYTTRLGIRNRPSDGSERSVVNAVWAVAAAPVDKEVAALEFECSRKYTLPRFGYYVPRVFAYNKYGVLIDTDFKDYTLTCDKSLGTIVDNGKSLFANGSGYGALTASYGNVSATQPVEISAGELKMVKESIFIDDRHPYVASVGAEVDGTVMNIDNSSLTWTSSDTNVATVDDKGTITGLSNGTAEISAKVEDFECSMSVTVEKSQMRYMPIADTSDASAWTVTTTGMTKVDLSPAADGGVKADYVISNTRTAIINLAQKSHIWAIPDSIIVELEGMTTKISSLKLFIADNQSNYISAAIKSIEPDAKGAAVAKFDVTAMTGGDILKYPLSFSKLEVTPTGGKGNDHSFVIKSIKTVYNHIAPSGVSAATIAGETLQVLPNPVEAGAAIHIDGIDADAECTIYTVSGIPVIKANAGTLTAPHSAGVYFIICPQGSCRLIVR